eukprot:1112499-Prymnesium_polylepis.1
MLGGGAGGGPRPEPRRLTATCWPVRVLGLDLSSSRTTCQRHRRAAYRPTPPPGDIIGHRPLGLMRKVRPRDHLSY